MLDDISHLDDIVNHIHHMQLNAIKIAKKLINDDQKDLGLKLLNRAFIHDSDKFLGIQWKYMRKGEKGAKIALAIEEHANTNPHHPEYHGSIHNMSDLDIAELVCDWGSRSAEFKTSLQQYIDEDASERYKFSKKDEIYQKIMYFKNLMCDQPFKQTGENK